MTSYHDPVLLGESVDALNIRPDGIYIDVTFGGGGHSKEILNRLGDKGRLIAFDRDEDAGKNLITDKRFTLVRHNYRYMKNFLSYLNAIPADGLLADLGISSYQVNEAERGFSTRFDSALDMRMNREASLTARKIVNTYSEEKLTRVFIDYGEVSNGKLLSRRIIEARANTPIETTEELKKIASRCADRQHESQYYAKVFQALRIEVNDELESLKAMLVDGAEVLKPEGRLVVIAYHSLEDRLVKNLILKGNVAGIEAEKDLFGNKMNLPFKAIGKKPIEASSEEIARNPRARSAKLRIAERN